MIVAIHQPHYFPWLRYLHKMASCDVFVLLDDVQFSKNGWQNRNKIKGPQGAILLTVPVQDPAFKMISEVRIHFHMPWQEKHWKSLLFHYSKSPFFMRYREFIEPIFSSQWQQLSDLNLTVLEALRRAFGISTTLVRGSTLGIEGHGTERLVRICRMLGASRYLTGAYAASSHFDTQMFADSGIEVLTQTWDCPTYGQQFPQAGFIADLSCVDLLFNEGPASLRILRNGGGTSSSTAAGTEEPVNQITSGLYLMRRDGRV